MIKLGKNRRQKSRQNTAKNGLGSRIRAILQGHKQDENLFENIEDLLIESDFGSRCSLAIVEELRELSRTSRSGSGEIIKSLQIILESRLLSINCRPDQKKCCFYLFMGVNGVGKTTTVSKFLDMFVTGGRKDIVVAAADTFRAAAMEQLAIHCRKHGVRLVKQNYGADPAAVVHDVLSSAHSRGEKIIITDTAGRVHTRNDLMEQLVKIDRVINSRLDNDALYHKLLVIDATTGQNAFSQAETFHQALGVDALILSKYDSTAGGGILFPICDSLNIPVAYLGCGEASQDLLPFEARSYVSRLLANAGGGGS